MRYTFRKAAPQTKQTENERLDAIFTTLIRWIYTQGMNSGQLPSVVEIERRFEELWWEGKPKPTAGSVLFGTYEAEFVPLHVLTMLHKLTTHLRNNSNFAVLGVALPFTIRFTGVSLSGIMPVVREVTLARPTSHASVPRRLELVVYRVQSGLSQGFMLASDLELSAYALAFRDTFARKEDAIRTVELRSGKERLTTRSPSDLRRLEGTVRMVAAAMQANLHHPRPGPHCLRCPYQIPCLEWRLPGFHD